MAAPPKVSLQKLLTICAVCLSLAVAITLIFHPEPKIGAWIGGPPINEQLSIVVLLGVLSLVGVLAVRHAPRLRPSSNKPSAAATVDLSGAKPLVFSVLAGIGEESLFRGALQPLCGIWLASFVFAVLHFRTARFVQGRLKQFTYLLGVFAASIGLGLAYEHFGLMVAIALHTAVDFVALSYWQVANTRAETVAPA
jgi:uncharacterized protein